VKEVARGDTSTEDLLPRLCWGKLLRSKVVEMQRQLKDIRKRAINLFMRLPKCQIMHEIGLTVPSSKFRRNMEAVTRSKAALLSQLRMGHVLLAKHLHKIGKVASPVCLAC